ncbi:MAG: gamma-glutamylcyclotransferase [Flavobacteriaceae bacterium]|nr:gamma-glutamylcyclotransferase [Flavobacteriaceae bacterium]
MKNEINSSSPRKGYLNNYTLKIGNRASLIQCEKEKAYGVLMTVNNEEIIKLYTEKSVADYTPEKVEIITDRKEHLRATFYNLPLKLLSENNELYAKSIYKSAKKLNFPQEYLKPNQRSASMNYSEAELSRYQVAKNISRLMKKKGFQTLSFNIRKPLLLILFFYTISPV